MKTITFHDLMIHVSGEYLCDNFPENLPKMSTAEVLKFISENIYEPFENETPEEVWQLIENGAEALATFLESKGIKIKRK